MKPQSCPERGSGYFNAYYNHFFAGNRWYGCLYETRKEATDAAKNMDVKILYRFRVKYHKEV